MFAEYVLRELQNVVRALLVEGRSARTITDASVISVFSRHRVVDRLPDAPSESSTTRTAVKSCGEIGEWVLDELRKAHFNFALARRTLEARRYSSPDPKSVPVFSRASLTYYFQGEALKALLKEGWNRAAGGVGIFGWG